MTTPPSLNLDNTPARMSTRRRIALLMAGIAVTLAVASVLHLSGNVHGSEPFDATRAGIAEALIGVVLAAGAFAIIRDRQHGRAIALGAIGFSTVGFVVGLNFTVRGGHLPDVIYHLAVLPLLIASLIVLTRGNDAGRHEEKEERPCPPPPSTRHGRSTTRPRSSSVPAATSPPC